MIFYFSFTLYVAYSREGTRTTLSECINHEFINAYTTMVAISKQGYRKKYTNSNFQIQNILYSNKLV